MNGPDAGFRLVAIALAWLAGAALQLREPVLSPAGLYVALVATALAALLAAWRWRARRVTWWLAVLAASALSFGQAGLQATARVDDRIDASLEGRDLRVTGVIASLPVQSAAGQRFRLEVERAVEAVDGSAVVLPAQLLVGWYVDGDAVPHAVRAGERWELTLRLKRPHGSANPHGFDFELWLFEQGVGATGYVRGRPAARRLDAAAGHPVERLRQALRDAIDAHVPDRRIAGLLAALTVGDQSAIERDDWDVYRATGVAHLMSISGLHVTMFAWLAGALIGAAWRRSERARTWCPTPTAARWGGLACAAAYALLAGWGVPAQRTVLMVGCVALLRSLGIAWPWPPVLLAAAVVVTAFDPWALLQPGFWLSFAAVGLLLTSQPVQSSHPPAPGGAVPGTRLGALLDAMRRGLRTQAIATLGLAPLTLVLFQQLSIVGFAANLVAIPLVTLLITPLALAGALLPPLWQLASLVSQPLVAALSWAATLPGAVWTVPVAPAWAQLAGLLAGALAIAPLPLRLRLLAVPLALPLLIPPVDRPADGRFDLLAADVGQGTAVLVRTREHLLLYDAGPTYSPDSDAGHRVLLPLLRALGERRIDTLLLSHRDTDHVGGAAALLQAMPVGELLHSLEAGHPLLALHPAPRGCAAGRSWDWDGVHFELLHPVAGDTSLPPKPNAHSCVLRVSGVQGSALLTGDIEAAQEQALVAREGERLASDVLVVPHHGSRTSSTDAFLDAVMPRIAVVQAGYRNRFGHPAAPVVERYTARGIVLVRSDDCGAWRWRADDDREGCQRLASRRYWQHSGSRPGGGPD